MVYPVATTEVLYHYITVKYSVLFFVVWSMVWSGLVRCGQDEKYSIASSTLNIHCINSKF